MRIVQRFAVLAACGLLALGQQSIAGITIDYPEEREYEFLDKYSSGYKTSSNGDSGTVVLTVKYKSPGGLGFFDTLGSGSGSGYGTFAIYCANSSGVWVDEGDYSYHVQGGVGTPPVVLTATNYPSIP